MDTAKSNCKLDPVPDISPDVDVVLVVGPRNLRLIIQSQVLRCASKVFSAMFGPLGVKGELLDMASTHAQERLLDAAFEHFATSLLPLYSGPQVTIRIGSASHEYKLPKALLCKQSPYLAAMFEGPFKEGEEQSTTLEEISIKAAYLTSCQSLVSGLSSTRAVSNRLRTGCNIGFLAIIWVVSVPLATLHLTVGYGLGQLSKLLGLMHRSCRVDGG